MWRPWDTESEEEQWDKSTSKGISVLASNSDDSVIFVAEKPMQSIEQPQVVRRDRAGALPTFSCSDTSSSLGEY